MRGGLPALPAWSVASVSGLALPKSTVAVATGLGAFLLGFLLGDRRKPASSSRPAMMWASTLRKE